MDNVVSLNPMLAQAQVVEQVERINLAVEEITATVCSTMEQLEYLSEIVTHSGKPSPDIDAEIRDEIMNLAADLQTLWLQFGGSI